MKDLLIIKNVMNNLHELLVHNKTYADYKSIDSTDEFTNQADYERRFRAWILMAYLVNDLHSMGLFSNDDRLRILNVLDHAIIKEYEK